MKILAILPAALFAAAPVLAGPYVNVETNSGFVGSDYTGSTTDVHIGVEGDGWYVQGGPALLAPDNVDGEVELSGKAGGSYGINEALSVYGEVSFLTGDTNSYGTKAGLKYNFE
jgi:hypothetical protein